MKTTVEAINPQETKKSFFRPFSGCFCHPGQSWWKPSWDAAKVKAEELGHAADLVSLIGADLESGRVLFQLNGVTDTTLIVTVA